MLTPSITLARVSRLQRAIEAEKSVTALETLRETPYFHSCPESALRRLAAASSIHEHAAGELVVCQDSAAHSLVIVIDGSLHVYVLGRMVHWGDHTIHTARMPSP